MANSGCASTTNKIIIYISFIIGLVLNFFIIYTLYKLEESHCDCSNIPEKRFIKEWFVINITFSIIIIFAFMFSEEECYQTFIENTSLSFIIYIMALINIIMLVRLFIYIRILKKTCDCGYGRKEKFLYWYTLIIISMFLFLITIAAILIVITIILMLMKGGSDINVNTISSNSSKKSKSSKKIK